jgi:hypothetical protein
VQDDLGVAILRLALLRQKDLLDLARVSWKYRIKRPAHLYGRFESDIVGPVPALQPGPEKSSAQLDEGPPNSHADAWSVVRVEVKDAKDVVDPVLVFRVNCATPLQREMTSSRRD